MMEEIPNSEIAFNVVVGQIILKNPTDGIYTLYVTHNNPQNYPITIAYTDGADSIQKDFQGFNHADTVFLTFNLNSASPDKITINLNPLPPSNLGAEAVEDNGLKTQLSWNANTDPEVTGYNVYSKYEDEPYLSQIGTSSGSSYSTGHDWAASSSIKTRMYAITAKKADGSESFLSNWVANNDRDHDGLTDAEETALGTNLSNPDTDGDGLLDGEEYYLGTDPKLGDTDGDGYSDRVEVLAGSDPLDPTSIPTYFLYLPIILK
jgi:hypothetical protein